MKITSPELQKLIATVQGFIIEQPTDHQKLNLSLMKLVAFLSSSDGRTDQHCKETDSYFLLHDENGFNWNHLPDDYQLILDDIGGQQHDSIENPEIAKNFESTPEQLLERIQQLQPKMV